MSLVPWKTSTVIPDMRSRLLQDVDAFQREINKLTGDFFNGGSVGSPLMLDESFYPAMDITEKEDMYILDADMPGLTESDVDIDFYNNILTIKGEKKTESKTKDSDYVCVERTRGSFRRDISFDNIIDQDKIKAELKSGILHVELTKKEGSKEIRKKIEIKH